jgi:hypothetical protein
MTDAKSQYIAELQARKAGHISQLEGDATLEEVKPPFYADARILSLDALKIFNDFRQTYPPYGLVTIENTPLVNLRAGSRMPWRALNLALRHTGHMIFDTTRPSLRACPYHEALSSRLGGTQPPLRPFDYNVDGLDTLRNVVTPGAELNAALFVSLVRRLPELQALHGDTSDQEAFARRSVVLLEEPLQHPQQWAMPFVLTLGKIGDFLTSNYLSDDMALEYTKIEKLPSGQTRLNWAIPTENFTTKTEVHVADRTRGSEMDLHGSHIATYPVGTRLADIAITEPTIGCPGNQLARAMWQRTIDVAVGESLWQ